jgi:FeS assembly protein IscX
MWKAMRTSMTWDDVEAIGRALAEIHPRVNYLTISDQDLVRLVVGLPGFVGGATPPDPIVLSAIGSAWVGAVEGPDDSGPYDGMA